MYNLQKSTSKLRIKNIDRAFAAGKTIIVIIIIFLYILGFNLPFEITIVHVYNNQLYLYLSLKKESIKFTYSSI